MLSSIALDGWLRVDDRRQRDLQNLLVTLSMCNGEERARLLEGVANDDPELAAHLTAHLHDPILKAPDSAVPSLTPWTGGLPDHLLVTRRIGQGGFGTVYEAYDRRRGETVAVKLLRQPDPEALYRFKQEFRVLAKMDHPNLIRFYELGEYCGNWFLSMELIRGVNFTQYVRARGECDFLRLRQVTKELTSVLSWLHRRKLLHLDVKPDNVLVEDSGRLVLLDFGLARHINPNASLSQAFAGTPAYMAPEQMADLGSVGEGADWYAVGALLYDAIAGKIPFQGSLLDLVSCKAGSAPPPPSTLVPGISQEWDDLCVRLLQPLPDKRPTGAEMVSLFGGDQMVPAEYEQLTGRTAVLEKMVTASQSPAPYLIEISGDPGVGKTRLLRALAEAILERKPGAYVIVGECHEQTSVPYKAVDAIIDELSRRLRQMGDTVTQVVPADAAALACMFPVLERVPAVAETSKAAPVRIANRSELRRRAFLAFTELIEALCTIRPVVFCIDDVQWGDADSAALLEQVLSGVRSSEFGMALAYRSGEEGVCVEALRRCAMESQGRIVRTPVELEPLDGDAASTLARSMLRGAQVSDDTATAIATQSGGNPLLIEQLVNQVVLASLETEPPERSSLAQLVRERVSRLSKVARQFLEMVAAIGEPLPETVAAYLVEEGAMRSSVIESLVSEDLLRRRVVSGVREVAVEHEQIRAAVLGDIPEPQKRALHVRIAAALVAGHQADEGMIAAQFALGGDRLSAAEHAEYAARDAETKLGFAHAAQFYAMALALGEHDDRRRSELYERLAGVQASAGRGPEAAKALLQAADCEPGAVRSTDLQRMAAEQLIRSGNIKEGIEILTKLGARFQIRHSDSSALAIASILWSQAVLRIRGLKYQERKVGQISASDLARLEIYWSLIAGLSTWNPVIGASFILKHFRLALSIGDPRWVALGQSAYAGQLALEGEQVYTSVRRLLGSSSAVGERLADPHIAGTVKAMESLAAYFTGRWELAALMGEQAEKILLENCGGVAWELTLARNGILGGLVWGGHWRRYGARLEEFRRDAQDRGDLNSLAIYRASAAPMSLSADDPERALTDMQEAEDILSEAWSDRPSHVPHAFSLLGYTWVLPYCGRAANDFDEVERRFLQLKHSILMKVETLNILVLLHWATFLIAAATGSSAQERIGRATAIARALRRRSAIWKTGPASLIEAGCEAASGRLQSAVACWADAELEFERTGMRIFAAAVRHRRGVVSGDTALTANAESALAAEGVVAPARMAAIIAPGLHSLT